MVQYPETEAKNPASQFRSRGRQDPDICVLCALIIQPLARMATSEKLNSLKKRNQAEANRVVSLTRSRGRQDPEAVVLCALILRPQARRVHWTNFLSLKKCSIENPISRFNEKP